MCLVVLTGLGFAGTVSAQTPDLSLLFAPPTTTEIDTVNTDWNNRDVQPYAWQTVGSGTILGGFSADVVSHEVAGNIHYGLVRPPQNYDPTQRYPILIVNHGGTGGVGAGILNQFSQGCYSDFFLVAPSFRGETLRTESIGLGDLVSEGSVSEFDGDIDDTLALLNGTIANYPGADASNIAIFGGSRGAAVSYLMSVRDQRIKRGVYFFGATDHMTFPQLQETVQTILDMGNGQGPFYATVTNIAEDYLAGTIPLDAARLALLSRSPIHFLDQFPPHVQIHHGDEDNAVPVENSQQLDLALSHNNLPTGEYAYYEYPGGGHGSNMPESGERRNEFLCATLDTTTIPTAVTHATNHVVIEDNRDDLLIFLTITISLIAMVKKIIQTHQPRHK